MTTLVRAGAGEPAAAADEPVADASCCWRPYTQHRTAQPPVRARATDNTTITLEDGRTLIDGIASWWTAVHGYNHPHIRAAVTAQLEIMPHIMFGGLTHDPAERLARRLAAILPGDLRHVFFSDSGSVSVEVAIKMAIQFWINRGVSGRSRLLAFSGGYHGDTLAAMSVCDPEEGMHSLFRGVLPEQVITSFDDFEAALARHASELAAVIVEPLVQGAGGMRVHAPETLRAIRAACDRNDVLLIADEVFTGFARTSTMFACERAEIIPDIICLSKALTGGTMALAATVARPHVFKAFLSDDPARALMHGPTFMANPLACAAANASLDLFETEPRLAQAARIEAALRDGLTPCRRHANVRDVRVLGAIGAVELARMPPLDALKQAFLDRNLFVRPFGRIVYLTPALTIEPADLERLMQGVRDVVQQT